MDGESPGPLFSSVLLVADDEAFFIAVLKPCQVWSAEEVADDTREAVTCLACTPVHLAELKTRKVLGEMISSWGR